MYIIVNIFFAHFSITGNKKGDTPEQKQKTEVSENCSSFKRNRCVSGIFSCYFQFLLLSDYDVTSAPIGTSSGVKGKLFPRPVLDFGCYCFSFLPRTLPSPLLSETYPEFNKTVSAYCLVLWYFLFLFFFKYSSTTASIRNRRYTE